MISLVLAGFIQNEAKGSGSVDTLTWKSIVELHSGHGLCLFYTHNHNVYGICGS